MLKDGKKIANSFWVSSLIIGAVIGGIGGISLGFGVAGIGGAILFDIVGLIIGTLIIGGIGTMIGDLVGDIVDDPSIFILIVTVIGTLSAIVMFWGAGK